MAIETRAGVLKDAESEIPKFKANVYLQYLGKEFSTKEILVKAKNTWMKESGKGPEDIKSINIYVKPEEFAAYYVINDDATGKLTCKYISTANFSYFPKTKHASALSEKTDAEAFLFQFIRYPRMPPPKPCIQRFFHIRQSHGLQFLFHDILHLFQTIIQKKWIFRPTGHFGFGFS